MEKSTLFEVESVLHTHHTIQFTWRDLGGLYYVYRDNSLLYEGTVATFRDGQFKHAKLYHYAIERVVDGVVVDVIRLQTSGYAQERNVENPLQFLVMTTIIAQSQIALSWEKIKDITSYEVYRNGVFLAEVKGNQYCDRAVELDKPYIYRIQSKRLIEQSEEKYSKGKSMVATVIEKFHGAHREPAIEAFTVVKQIGPLNDLLRPTIQRIKKPKINQWQFRYMTFLRDETVKNPNPLSRNRVFQGDHRDFQVESERFRTRVDLSLNYEEQQSPMICTKRIGKTIVQDHAGNIRKVARADYEGIQFKRMDHQIGESGFLLTHDVGNPLVPAPKINYEVRAVFRRDGLFDCTGFHNQAPHHEVYIANEAQEWMPIHLAESNGLIWMADLMGWHYWRHVNFV